MTSPTTHQPDQLGRQLGDELARLARVRTGVRAVLALGIAASVAANILHAQDNTVGRLVAAWPPVALLLAIELLSRVPVHRPWLSALRLSATAAVAGIAAWVSYWHMVSVAAAYGESSTSAHLIPLSVDGLVVVASVCLVELGARITALTTAVITGTTAAGPVAVGREDHADQPHQPRSEPAGLIPTPAPVRPRRAASSSSRITRTATGTGEAIARTRARHPEWTTAQIAARVGVTDRTVRRHLNSTTTEPTTSTDATTDTTTDTDTTGVAA